MNDIDLVGHLGAAIDRARMRVATHEQLGDTTDAAEHGAEEAPPVGQPAVASPSSAPDPLTGPELGAIIASLWADLEDDPYRVGDLLADAVGFIGGVALGEHHPDSLRGRAAGLLRRMEQRALWGPDGVSGPPYGSSPRSCRDGH